MAKFRQHSQRTSVVASPMERLRTAVADEAMLRRALEEADIVPQLLAQAQLSGDTDLLDAARPYIHGGWSYMEEIPDALRRTIRERLIETLKACAAASLPPPSHPSPDRFQEIMSVGIGLPIPREYVGMMLEEMNEDGRDSRTVEWRTPPGPALDDFNVIIIGAGLAGLCMGAKLRAAGIRFTIYEKNEAVGGTWHENSYPGAGVDIPNHFYSYSFEPKHDWSHHFAKRDELWAYLDACADKFDVRRDIRFHTEVIAARFDEAASVWHVTLRTNSGAVVTASANVLVSAVGQLNRPSIPAIPGLDSFAGPAFHSARWDHNQDLSGRRVALVGTGASSMQVGPAIAPEVDRLLIFQRSPNWAAHNPNYHLRVTEGMKWALQNIPFLAKWHRFLLFWASGDVLHASLQVDPDWPLPHQSLNAANQKMRDALIEHIRKEIGDDPELLAKVIPDYPPYGKRMLRDNNWYRMLKRENVELISAAVTRIEPDAIVDATGRTYPVDVIILATGFQASRMLWPMEITGRGGRTIRDVWGDDDPRAYLGVTVPGFPNLFLLYGPNTNLAHGGSLFFHAECQVRYIMQCLRELIEGGHGAMECRQEPHNAYNRRVDEAHSRMVWTHGGMRNWYKNSKGRVVANSPWRLVDYWQLTAELNPADYVFTPAPARDATGAPRKSGDSSTARAHADPIFASPVPGAAD